MVGPQDVWECVCVCVCVCVFLLSTCLNGRSARGVSTQTDTTHSSSICEGKEDFYCPWGYRRGHWGSAGGGAGYPSRIFERTKCPRMLVQFDSLAELWPPSIPTMTRPKRDIEFSRRFKVHKEADFKQDKWRLAPSVYLSIYDVLNSYNTGTLSDILKHFKVHVRPFFTRFWSQLDGAVWTWSCFFFTERALLRCEKPAEAGLLDLTQKTKKKRTVGKKVRFLQSPRHVWEPSASQTRSWRNISGVTNT